MQFQNASGNKKKNNTKTNYSTTIVSICKYSSCVSSAFIRIVTNIR